MPITPTKTLRRNTVTSYNQDGFKMSSHKEVFTVSHYKSFIRPRNEVVKDANPLPHWNCIRCNNEYTAMVGSIYGRILKGFRVKMGKKIILVDAPDPNGGKNYPSYSKGHVCSACSPKLKMTNKSPLAGEIQFIKDPTIEIRPHDSVTTDMMRVMDEDIERLDAQTKQDKAGAIQAGRIKIPLGKMAVAVKQPDEPIDTNAFRKFMKTRNGGGKKDYESRLINKIDSHNKGDLYDSHPAYGDVNYSNIKKG